MTEQVKNNISLQFPAWEYIKKLPLTEEYRWIIFYTGIRGTYGILTWNEDWQKKLIFDVFVGGHSGESGYEKVFAGNKEGYKKMCKYVFEVYQTIFRNLKSDVSWQWEVNEVG
jgi:hypothetical protein